MQIGTESPAVPAPAPALVSSRRQKKLFSRRCACRPVDGGRGCTSFGVARRDSLAARVGTEPCETEGTPINAHEHECFTKRPYLLLPTESLGRQCLLFLTSTHRTQPSTQPNRHAAVLDPEVRGSTGSDPLLYSALPLLKSLGTATATALAPLWQMLWHAVYGAGAVAVGVLGMTLAALAALAATLTTLCAVAAAASLMMQRRAERRAAKEVCTSPVYLCKTPLDLTSQRACNYPPFISFSLSLSLSLPSLPPSLPPLRVGAMPPDARRRVCELAPWLALPNSRRGATQAGFQAGFQAAQARPCRQIRRLRKSAGASSPLRLPRILSPASPSHPLPCASPAPVYRWRRVSG